MTHLPAVLESRLPQIVSTERPIETLQQVDRPRAQDLRRRHFLRGEAPPRSALRLCRVESDSRTTSRLTVSRAAPSRPNLTAKISSEAIPGSRDLRTLFPGIQTGDAQRFKVPTTARLQSPAAGPFSTWSCPPLTRNSDTTLVSKMYLIVQVDGRPVPTIRARTGYPLPHRCSAGRPGSQEQHHEVPDVHAQTRTVLVLSRRRPIRQKLRDLRNRFS